MKVYLANPHSPCGSAGQNKASEGQSSRGARQILLTIGYFGVHFKLQQPQIDQYSRVKVVLCHGTICDDNFNGNNVVTILHQ